MVSTQREANHLDHMNVRWFLVLETNTPKIRGEEIVNIKFEEMIVKQNKSHVNFYKRKILLYL